MTFYIDPYRKYENYLRSRFKGLQYDIPSMPDWVGMRVFFPFGGAFARVVFYVRERPQANVSTYLDAEGNLGAVAQPYFEIHPDKTGNNARFLIAEQPEMYREIIASLEKQMEASDEA
jgi:hypothetical protein